MYLYYYLLQILQLEDSQETQESPVLILVMLEF